MCFHGQPVSSEEQQAAVGWAARHPSLRQLCTGSLGKQVSLDLHCTLMEAQRQKPGLAIVHGSFQWMLEEEDSDGDSNTSLRCFRVY